MMYQKARLFGDEEVAEKILGVSDPGKQKALGRTVKNFDENVWKSKCKEIVYQGCMAKFSQNENLLKHLLGTKNTTLVEASPKDIIWGIGWSEEDPKAWSRSTWRGKNWLGEILIQIREELIRARAIGA